MLVSADELKAAAIAQVLGEDELILTRITNRRMALALAPSTAPDLVILRSAGDGLAAATDYPANPITWPMLRTRVHSWLVRRLAKAHMRTHGPVGRARRTQT